MYVLYHSPWSSGVVSLKSPMPGFDRKNQPVSCRFSLQPILETKENMQSQCDKCLVFHMIPLKSLESPYNPYIIPNNPIQSPHNSHIIPIKHIFPMGVPMVLFSMGCHSFAGVPRWSLFLSHGQADESPGARHAPHHLNWLKKPIKTCCRGTDFNKLTSTRPGQPLHNYRKPMKITHFHRKTHYHWPFSIAMLVIIAMI